MAVELGNIIVAPTPARSDDLKIYQQNIETWCRQVEQAIHQLEKYLRAIAAGS